MIENEATKVVEHYSQGDLLATIKTALLKQGKSIETLTEQELLTFDELHVGGREATQQLTAKISLPEEALILDVGSGLGGPVRVLNAGNSRRVVGVDLAFEFCEVASALTQKQTSENCLGFVNGNALSLPFKSNLFSAILNQHCSMNIRNKKRLYQECFRALKPGGFLLVHDITAGQNQPILFPVPWAKTAEVSFLLDWGELKQQILEAGFNLKLENDITDRSYAWYGQQKQRSQNSPKPPLNQKMIFGENLKAMAGNMKQNMKEKRINVIEAVFTKN